MVFAQNYQYVIQCICFCLIDTLRNFSWPSRNDTAEQEKLYYCLQVQINCPKPGYVVEYLLHGDYTAAVLETERYLQSAVGLHQPKDVHRVLQRAKRGQRPD